MIHSPILSPLQLSLPPLALPPPQQPATASQTPTRPARLQRYRATNYTLLCVPRTAVHADFSKTFVPKYFSTTFDSLVLGLIWLPPCLRFLLLLWLSVSTDLFQEIWRGRAILRINSTHLLGSLVCTCVCMCLHVFGGWG